MTRKAEHLVTQSQAVQLFIKTLDDITSRDGAKDNREKFKDLMEMAYCAYAKLTAPSPERADALEAQYMHIVNTYENKDTVRAYPELLQIAEDAIYNRGEGGIDFLGTVAGQMEILNASRGQFFTPYEMCRLLAQLNIDGVHEAIGRQGFVDVNECAAGAGAIVLAFADEMAHAGFNPMQHMKVVATELDTMAFHMLFLQLTWRGIPAYVYRGNTMSQQMSELAITPCMHVFAQHHPECFGLPAELSTAFSDEERKRIAVLRDFASEMGRASATIEVVTNQAETDLRALPAKAYQLSLFDSIGEAQS